MEVAAQYLEYAQKFERLAAKENNPQIKIIFENQAAMYRKLIADQTKKLRLNEPKIQP